MNKLIICVKSCQRDLERGDHHTIRQTWGKDAKAAGIDVRFFVGASDLKNRYEPDEVAVNADDDYRHLPFKTREICKWASAKVLNHVFLCDTDTYVSIKYLLTCHYEQYDYMGMMPRPIGKTFQYSDDDCEGVRQHWDRCYTWASGGVGYFLSKKALTEVAYAFPNIWAEDMWVGQVLGPLQAIGEINCMNTRENNYTGNIFSWHFPKAEFGEPYNGANGWMWNMHKQAR